MPTHQHKKKGKFYLERTKIYGTWSVSGPLIAPVFNSLQRAEGAVLSVNSAEEAAGVLTSPKKVNWMDAP